MNKKNQTFAKETFTNLTHPASLKATFNRIAKEQKDNYKRLLEENYLNALNHFGAGRNFEY